MTQTSRKINGYYSDLLTLQYQGRPKARATISAVVSPIVMHQTSVQVITFDQVPTSGSVYLRPFEGAGIAIAINWDNTAADLSSLVQSLPGFSDVILTGSPADKAIQVKLMGIDVMPPLMFTDSNSMVGSGGPVAITVEELDEPLPLAVQNGFDIRPGHPSAVGKQLDVVGKYVGASRIGRGFSTFVNLTDDEYTLLIRAAIGRNYSGSSLAAIDEFLQAFFPGQIFVYDYENMHLGYFISPGTLSSNLLQTFIGQGLLPKPMGVKIAPIIYSLSDELLFGFNSYTRVNPFASPFNTYADYKQDVTWLTYAYVISV